MEVLLERVRAGRALEPLDAPLPRQLELGAEILQVLLLCELLADFGLGLGKILLKYQVEEGIFEMLLRYIKAIYISYLQKLKILLQFPLNNIA